MSLQNLLKTLKTTKNLRQNSYTNEEIQNLITKTLTLTNTTQLTPETLNQILTDPNYNPSTCFHLFNFLLNNQSLISFKPNLQTHLTLISKLVKAREFSQAEHLLKKGSFDEHPLSDLASSIQVCCLESKRVRVKLLNMMLKVYSDNGKYERVREMFDYMKSCEVKIDEKTCTVHLYALTKNDEVGLALDFFYRMMESGMEVSVYSLTVVVDGLCRIGEIKKSRVFLEEMVVRGLKPNIITYNTIITACCKRWSFDELELVLSFMRKEEQSFSIDTYKSLIEGYSSNGKVEEADKLVTEMHDKGLKVDSHLHNLIINGYCKLGFMEKACLVFDHMCGRGVNQNADTYCALISGLCKNGKKEIALKYVGKMQEKGMELDRILCNKLLDEVLQDGM
ncbi:hypothetical protein ACFE04_006411 [Oxalis oulophora]